MVHQTQHRDSTAAPPHRAHCPAATAELCVLWVPQPWGAQLTEARTGDARSSDMKDTVLQPYQARSPGSMGEQESRPGSQQRDTGTKALGQGRQEGTEEQDGAVHTGSRPQRKRC